MCPFLLQPPSHPTPNPPIWVITELSFLCYTTASHQLSVLHIIVCVNVVLGSLPPVCPRLFSTSASKSLPHKWVHLELEESGSLTPDHNRNRLCRHHQA